MYAGRAVGAIQPTSLLHIGNYFGALVASIELQDIFPGQNFCFVADYHAQTVLPNSLSFIENSDRLILDFIALGLDPQRTTIYRQSDVPEIHEVLWLLSVFFSHGELKRNHAVQNAATPVNAAIYMYPLLMAADILGIRANRVPVGEDQTQHVERARHAARYFNNGVGEEFFEDPVIWQSKPVRIRGTDALRHDKPPKMSKSQNNYIPIFSSDYETSEFVDRIHTRQVGHGEELPTKGDTILEYFSLFASAEEIEELKSKYRSGKFGYGEAKELLAQKINEYFAPHRERRAELEKRRSIAFDVLRDGADRARREVLETLEHMRSLTGISRSML